MPVIGILLSSNTGGGGCSVIGSKERLNLSPADSQAYKTFDVTPIINNVKWKYNKSLENQPLMAPRSDWYVNGC